MNMKRILTLGLAALAVICMAPNRRAHDHIGNFNFKVEIEGIAVGGFKSSQGLGALLAAAGTPEVITRAIKFDGGRRAKVGPTQGRVMVNFILSAPTEGLPAGYTCTLGFAGTVVESAAGTLVIKPTGAARSNCR
jgi:hypothetical protein